MAYFAVFIASFLCYFLIVRFRCSFSRTFVCLVLCFYIFPSYLQILLPLPWPHQGFMLSQHKTSFSWLGTIFPVGPLHLSSSSFPSLFFLVSSLSRMLCRLFLFYLLLSTFMSLNGCSCFPFSILFLLLLSRFALLSQDSSLILLICYLFHEVFFPLMSLFTLLLLSQHFLFFVSCSFLFVTENMSIIELDLLISILRNFSECWHSQARCFWAHCFLAEQHANRDQRACIEYCHFFICFQFRREHRICPHHCVYFLNLLKKSFTSSFFPFTRCCLRKSRHPLLSYCT